MIQTLHKYAVLLLYIAGSLLFLAGSVLSLVREVQRS